MLWLKIMQGTTLRKLAYVELLIAIGILSFWTYFFWGGGDKDNPTIACYLAFERAFPIPDLILALGLAVSALKLFQNRSVGVVLSITSAGALVFLGLIDISFNLQQGVYAQSWSHLVLNGGINAVCIGFGLFTIAYFSQRGIM